METTMPGRVSAPTYPAAIGQRRLDLYDRTLRWLGGSLECNQREGSAEFSIRLPALEAR
jgi:hypothetical protein